MVALLALAALAWPATARAASWNLNANGNWNVAGNWTPAGFPNAVDATATLGGVITANRTITLGQNIRLGTLAIDSSRNYTVRNNRLIFDVSAGSAALTVTNLNGNGSHTIRSRLDLNDPLVLSQGSSGPLTISGRITGAGSLTKLGAGTVILTGNNTYAGGTTVSAGTLQGNTTSLKGSITNDAVVIFNQTGNGTYAGVMTGTGSLTKLGGARLTLTGANSYAGGTTVSAGRLRANTTSLPGDVVNDAISGVQPDGRRHLRRRDLGQRSDDQARRRHAHPERRQQLQRRHHGERGHAARRRHQPAGQHREQHARDLRPDARPARTPAPCRARRPSSSSARAHSQ